MRPPTPPTEPSAGVERWIGSSRCLVRAAVLVCVRDDLMPDRLLPGRQVPVIFRIARDCEADHTAAAVGKRHAADHYMLACMLQCADTEDDGSAPCKGDHIHDDRCSDRH